MEQFKVYNCPRAARLTITEDAVTQGVKVTSTPEETATRKTKQMLSRMNQFEITSRFKLLELTFQFLCRFWTMFNS